MGRTKRLPELFRSNVQASAERERTASLLKRLDL